MISRGIKNNNPGNIRSSVSRFKGEVIPSRDASFKEFGSMDWGYRAMFLIIHNYDQLYGINTLDKIIERWAPPVENDTRLYIKAVAMRLGVDSRAYIDSLNAEVMQGMVSAMTRIECGVVADRDAVSRGWDLFIEERC